MKKVVLLIFFLCAARGGFGQITFQKTYGGVNDDVGIEIYKDFGSGYIIGGSSYSTTDSFDVYLLKIDSVGNILWSKKFGGTRNDYGNSVHPTNDHGYVIAGFTYSFGVGSDDAYLIKTDSIGNLLWSQTYGGIYKDEGYSVKPTFDGGYVIAGWTENFNVGYGGDTYVMKTDGLGTLVWGRAFGGYPSDEKGFSIIQNYDTNYVMGGYSNSYGVGFRDSYFMKCNTIGNFFRPRTYGGSNYEELFSISSTPDSGFITTGYTLSFGNGGRDIYLVRTNGIGDTLWTKTYGGAGDEYGYAVQNTYDNGFIICGYTNSFGAGGSDVFLIKVDSVGNIHWSKTYGGLGNDYGRSVQQTPDSGYIICGYTNSFGLGGFDVYIIKTDSNGNSGCFEGIASATTGVTATLVTDDFPWENTGGSSTFPLTVATNAGTMLADACVLNIPVTSSFKKSFTLSPNPATNQFTISSTGLSIKEITIYNVVGEKVYSKQMTNDKGQMTVDASKFRKGIYFVRVAAQDFVAVKKLVIE